MVNGVCYTLYIRIVPCSENAVRLNEEVVQVCHNQQWGLVCDSDVSWDQPSVTVTCNQAGTPSIS